MDWRLRGIASNIRTFGRNHEADPLAVVSIKLRPVAKREGPSDRYVYSAEYTELAQAFGFSVDVDGGYFGSKAHRLNSRVVLVEHETGPEILLFIKDVAEAVEPAVTLAGAVSLVANVVGWLSRKIKENCAKQSPDRHYHDARMMRIEQRQIETDGSIRETIVEIVDLGGEIDKQQLSAKLMEAISSRR